jgi:folate-binding protein YgfZ
MPAGVAEGDAEAYEAWRIAAGVPRMGAELDERTIPAEAGVVDRSVSFTKGCYTGQELVARVDSRGSSTPRRLRSIVLDAAGPAAGDALTAEGREIGVLTSVSGVHALGYVRREAADLTAAEVAGIRAELRDLATNRSGE